MQSKSRCHTDNAFYLISAYFTDIREDILTIIRDEDGGGEGCWMEEDLTKLFPFTCHP